MSAIASKQMDVSRVKALFEEAGVPISEWARLHGFSTALVYQVLDGNRLCLRGQSHRIAIALGLKKGVVIEMDQLSELLKTGRQIADR